MDFSYIDRNVADIRKRMANAVSLAGRGEGDVLLLAAVKYAESDWSLITVKYPGDVSPFHSGSA